MSTKKVAHPPAEEKRNPTPPTYHPTVPGRADFEFIRANRFELVDGAGKVRGFLGFSDKGYPMMALVDDRGDDLTPRAKLILTTDGPGLALSDAAGTHRATMNVKDSGSVTLALSDAKGALKVCALVEDREVTLRTFDSKGQPWSFVQDPPSRLSPAQTIKAIESAANRDGKRGFVRAMGKFLHVHDTAKIEDMWKDAVKRGARKAKGRKAA